MHTAFKHTFALLVHIHLKTNQQGIFIEISKYFDRCKNVDFQSQGCDQIRMIVNHQCYC